jgi:hypothetical protein
MLHLLKGRGTEGWRRGGRREEGGRRGGRREEGGRRGGRREEGERVHITLCSIRSLAS